MNPADKLTSHFSVAEFRCKCQTCQAGSIIPEMDPLFMLRLEATRVLADIPFIIRSGYRCELHNASQPQAVSGSAHTTGHAADIAAPDSATRFKIIFAAQRAGFTRIGIHPSFIHLDNDPGKPQEVAWMYLQDEDNGKRIL